MPRRLVSILVVGGLVLMVRWSALALGVEPAADHPLTPLITFAEQSAQRMQDTVRDYTCTIIKREHLDGKLGPYEHAFMKLRHQQVRDGRVSVPFSVYLRFLGPAEIAGREVLYIEGRNNGKAIVHRGGTRFAYVTTAIDPQGELATRASRYPLTQIGIEQMLHRLIEEGRKQWEQDELEVKYFPGALVNKRPCTAVHFARKTRRPGGEGFRAEVFIDDELQLPVRYAGYDWPETPGGPPVLLEEYTYLDVRLNVGLVDWDFDYRNEDYQFSKTYQPSEARSVSTLSGQPGSN